MMEVQKCPICSNGKLRQETSDFKAQFEDGSGQAHEVVVRDVRKNVCDTCGEFLLDEESENRISSAQRAAMGLLSADELAAFRKSLEKTQEEMSDLLGLGKRTWCRWESNDHFQSESFDRYLRLLMFAPSNVRALETIELWKHGVARELLAASFPFIRDVQATEEFGKQFGAMLRSGPFRSADR
jgi:putative zinc finger/helix-turn-helix YgiT family protein